MQVPAKLFSRRARRAAAEASAPDAWDVNAPFRWSFADLEYQLAVLHGISPRQRTAFQARLKNFHKLGFPAGFKGSKGKAAQYGPGEIVLFALAVELTQFGMAPERVVRMLVDDWYATTMAIRMAASGILDTPEAFASNVAPTGGERLNMFLHFDPNALSNMREGTPGISGDDLSLMSFFYGGQGVVRDNLVRWTNQFDSCRLSLINVTALLYNIVGGREYEADLESSGPMRRQFFTQLIEWAIGFEPENAHPESGEIYVLLYLHHCFMDQASRLKRKDIVKELVARTGMPEDIVSRAVALQQKAKGDL